MFGKSLSIFEKYVAIASVYGFIRKTYQIINVRTETFENKTVPLLFMDKVGIVAASTVASMYLAPIWMYNDVRRLEILLRGLDENDYFSERKSKYRHHTDVIDCIFN